MSRSKFKKVNEVEDDNEVRKGYKERVRWKQFKALKKPPGQNRKKSTKGKLRVMRPPVTGWPGGDPKANGCRWAR